MSNSKNNPPVKSALVSKSLDKPTAATVKGLHAIIEHTGEISHFDCTSLERVLRAAAEAAGATVLGANFHDFGSGMGNTGVLMLAESHISVHTWPENNYAAIDIFVCNEDGDNSLDSVEAAIDVLRSTDRHGCFHCQIIQRAMPLATVGLRNTTRLVNCSASLSELEPIDTDNKRSQNENH